MNSAREPSGQRAQDPLSLYAQRCPLAGASFEEVGYRVKQALLTSHLRLGQVAQILKNTHVGAAALTQAAPELLPLPVPESSVEEANLRSAEAAGATPQHLRADFSRSLKTAGRHCWVYLMITLVNTLHIGNATASRAAREAVNVGTHEQLGVIRRFYDDVDFACAHVVPKVPDVKWSDMLRFKRVHYNGDVIVKGMALTWRQVERALPPPGIAGRISATHLASAGLRPWLRDPRRCMLPREEWPATLRRSSVRATRDEWNKICRGMYDRDIFSFLRRDQLIEHNGSILVNGAFGVPKEDPSAPDFDPEECTLRFIANLQPTNDLQRTIEAEIESLPVFTQWMLLELIQGEMFLVDSEDQTCSFFLYYLDEEWLPWFVFDQECTCAIPGVPADATWPAMRVLPMGWRSAAGVMEHLHLQLTRAWRLRLPAPSRPMELGRSTLVKPDEEGRIKDFFTVFLDNWDRLRRSQQRLLHEHKGQTSAEQAALRETLALWGVHRHEKKAVTSEPLHATLGAAIFGERGRSYPHGSKLAKFIGMVWYLATLEYIPYQYVLASGGHACFLLQFRRPLFIVLDSLWAVVHGHVQRKHRWAIVVEELLGVICSIPFLYIDFRQEVSTTVMCTDASLEGAGVCIARSLTPSGTERLMAELTRVPGIFEGRVVLVESCCGIGGGRRAFDILGVKPVLYFAGDINESALRVIRHAWPDAILTGDIMLVTEETFAVHADKAPLADLVIHAAGSPCPGLCGWNRIKGTKQVEESYRLYHQLEVVNLALEKAFPHATVKPLNENVASMAQESDGYISADQGILPLRVCPSSYSRQRRPRYYWAHWKVFRRRKVQVVTGERYIKVVLRPDTPVPDSKWISKGWKVARTARQFPTLTRPCPVKRPRFGTPGVDRASAFAKRQWAKDLHRRPPLHYERRNQVEREGVKRYRNYEEHERLHFYLAGHTFPCMNAKERRQNPQAFEDARGQLLGNCYHAGDMAFAFGELFYDIGWLAEPVDVDELVRQEVTLKPCATASPFASTVAQRRPAAGDEELVRLLRWLFHNQSGRGGEIRCITGSPHLRRGWQEIDVDWFNWETIISVPWPVAGDVINVCEARARLLGLRWRARRPELHGTRYLALMDSQVNLSHVAKGRTSSARMGHVEKQGAGYLIAAHMREIGAYTRSDRNPADGPSRDLRRWEAERRRRRREAETESRRSDETSRAEEPGAGRSRERPQQ